MRANSHSRLIIDQDSDRLGKLFDHNGGLLRLSLRRIQLAAVDEAAGERSQKGNPNDLKLGDHKMTLHCSAGHNIFRAALKKNGFPGLTSFDVFCDCTQRAEAEAAKAELVEAQSFSNAFCIFLSACRRHTSVTLR